MNDRAIPALPSTDFGKTERLFTAIGFEIASRKERWLRVRRGSLEVEFSLSELDWQSPELALADRLCIIRVADIGEWHARLSGARIRWKAAAAPSITSISTGAWEGTPAFCFTDYDHNLFWVVEAP